MTRNHGPVYQPEADPVKIMMKQLELSRWDTDLWGITHEAQVNQLVPRVARHLGRPETHSIIELGLGFQEDLVILHHGIMAAACFCFPSGWLPSEKLGLTLAQIHAPVAHSEHLVRVSQRLAQTMADPTLGEFRRTVWTLTMNSGLSNHPEYLAALQHRQPQGIQDVYFRWETQTSQPLGDGATSVFWVDTNVVPLAQVWSDLGEKITASVASMTPEILAYKGLAWAPELLKQLDNNTETVLV